MKDVKYLMNDFSKYRPSAIEKYRKMVEEIPKKVSDFEDRMSRRLGNRMLADIREGDMIRYIGPTMKKSQKRKFLGLFRERGKDIKHCAIGKVVKVLDLESPFPYVAKFTSRDGKTTYTELLDLIEIEKV